MKPKKIKKKIQQFNCNVDPILLKRANAVRKRTWPEIMADLFNHMIETGDKAK